jgi:hypothetical protein
MRKYIELLDSLLLTTHTNPHTHGYATDVCFIFTDRTLIA